ncbi:peptide chain release factor N(5)-glutamine methyltransferase [Patescibacteria group bacterium]|nr:MAG: peptide chain release factor N(5)-glutamine methyltransferase [Patescibacteria group bacterium]
MIFSRLENLKSEILLAHAIGKSREFILAHPEYKPSFWKRVKFKYYCRLRERGWPIAYITGHKEFYGLDFLVNKNVLIPRPETELMVEEVVRRIENRELRIEKTILIDVGTGSGCMPIAVARSLPLASRARSAPKGETKRGSIKLIATDISRAALRVAKKNAKKHGVKIKFLHGNLLEPVIHNSQFSIQYSSLIITANLPYLTAEQYGKEPSIQKEPRGALVADAINGLSLYEELLSQLSLRTERSGAKQSLAITDGIASAASGLAMTILLEIDPRQSEAIKTLIKKYLPASSCEIKTDLAGRDRLVIISIK